MRGDLLALPFDDETSTRRPSASASGTSPTSQRGLARAAARAAPGRPPRDPRDHAAARAAARLLLALVRRLVPLLGKVLPGGEAYTYLPASVRRFPGPDELAAQPAGFREVRLPALRRRHRRVAHGGARVTAAREIRTTPGLDAVPRRARGAARARGRGVSGRRRRRREGVARRRRQAPASAGRASCALPDAAQPSRPASRSSCCTWRRSCTTT